MAKTKKKLTFTDLLAEVESRIGEWSTRVDETGEYLGTLRKSHRALSGVDKALADVERAKAEWAAKNPAGAVHYLESAQHRYNLAHYASRLTLQRVIESAHVGKRFTEGRKPGTGGPIRKAIKQVLKRHRNYTPLDVWTSISNKPPKGWRSDHDRNGRHLCGPDGAHVGYRRFCNIVSEEKGLKPR